MPSILIVDDLLSIHEMLDAVIQPTGFSTAFATDGEKALQRYKEERFDLILADIDMRPMDGITLLKQVKAYDPSVVVIIMTAYASTESAVQALKHGAFDYLQKPFRVDELIGTLKRAMEFRKFQLERKTTSGGKDVALDVEGRLVGASPANQRIIQQVKKLLDVRTPVLLQGEAGTGKTTVAELLHQGNASSNDAPFIRIDCAFSSAEEFHRGVMGENSDGGEWVRQAKGGTLLLQRLECLSDDMQEELISVLRNTAHGFRVICTSCVDLERLADEGSFNDELFYRVASLPVSLVPLRERLEDIPALTKYFASRSANPNFDSNLIEFTPEALEMLRAYSWPGNLTELGQVVMQIAANTKTRLVGPDQIPLRIKDMKEWPTLSDYLAGHEKRYIEQVLNSCHGDKAKAAAVLGVDVSRLG